MKVCLPLSLLFACAVAPVSVFAGDATTDVIVLPDTVFSDPLIKKQWQWYPAQHGVEIASLWKAVITGAGTSAAYRAFVGSSLQNSTGFTGGMGVVIGVIDEWVEPTHEDLNVATYNPGSDLKNGLSKDFVGTESLPGSNPEDGGDEETQIYTGDSHGTFVAGMAAATGGNGVGLVGAAPGATIAGLHVAAGNSFNGNAVLSAAYWASGVSSQQGTGTLSYGGEAAIQVKNCSFGSVYEQNSTAADLNAAIKATSKNNVIYVFAAGNDRGTGGYGWAGTTGWSSYGNNASVINVAATNSKGTYTSFSCFGSNVFVSAPGEQVVSTDRSADLGYNGGGSSSSTSDEDDGSTRRSTISNPNYAASDGTSFSSPLVAGVVALGKEVCPVMDARWAKHAFAYSSGHGLSPNIDCVEKDGTWVQESGYTKTETDEDGDKVTTTVVSTGDWQKNKGGYWFNNNYGFGLVNPEGFVKTVRDIAYTTVETTYGSSLAGIVKTASAETDGKTRSLEYSVNVSMTGNDGVETIALDQAVETVSVTVNFSEAAIASGGFDINSLKVILTDSYGDKSVLVQQSAGDPKVSLGLIAGDDATSFSYTFLTNAFWGTSYSSANDWNIRIEYDGVDEDLTAVDMTDWVTVGSVDFTMGRMVTEGRLSVSERTENAHALSLDSGSFTVGKGGYFYVEDAVCVNAGSFTLDAGGTVGAYADAELKKGVIFVQTGGSSYFYGSAVFERGVHLYGGNFELYSSSIGTGSGGFVVNGGTFTVGKNADGAAVSAGAVTVNAGSLVLAAGSNLGSSVVVNGGSFAAKENSKGTAISVYGGVVTLDNRTSFGSFRVGASATDVADAKGGALNIAEKASVSVSGGISLDGVAAMTIGSEGSLKTDSALSVAGSATLKIGGKTKIEGTLALSGNGFAEWTGDTAIRTVTINGGMLSAAGETTLTTKGLTVGNGGAFKVGKTTVNGAVIVDAGATLQFASRTRSDFDCLDVSGKSSSLEFKKALVDERTTVRYDFGDALPYTAELIRYAAGSLSEESIEAAETIAVELIGDVPKMLTADPSGSGAYVKTDLTFGVAFSLADEKTGVLKLSAEGGFDNLHLYYSSETELHEAVQSALLRNRAALGDFLPEFNALEHVSELLNAYDQVGAPANVIAIDELHDKQANAITGALSRRSRELRSGFIHSDMWSNPLFGNSGFTFSARPNLVAAKGFVPYASAEDDFPLTVWLNGGYSFSEADDGAMSVSSTKSNMFNVVMGADYSVSDDFALGIFAGYTSGRTKFDDGGRTEIQSRNVGVYLAGSRSDSAGSLYYTAMASCGYEEYDFSRKLSVGSLNASASASPDGWQGIVFLEGGYEWKMNKFSMGPTLSLRYVLNNIDGYTETSGSDWMRQDVDDVSYDSLQSSVGWRIAYRADFETVSLLPELRLSWNHEFLGRDDDFDVRLALPESTTYSCAIANTGDDYATFGAGLTVMLGEVTTLSFDYDVQFLRDDADPTHSFNAMLRVRF